MKTNLSACLLALVFLLVALPARAQSTIDKLFLVTDCFANNPALTINGELLSYDDSLAPTPLPAASAQAEQQQAMEQLTKENLSLQFKVDNLQLEIELLSRRLAALETAPSATPATAGKLL